MDPFALLELPLIPRQKVLKFLEPIELFEFSQCSSTCALLVRDVKVDAVCHDVQLNRGSGVLSVKFSNGRKMIWWDFKPFFIQEYLMEKRKVGGILFDKCMKTQQPLINVEEFYCKYPDVEEGIIAVAKHLTFIFQGPVRLNIVPSLIKNLSAFFTEPHFKICEELEIDGDETVTEEQLAQIFENVTVTKKLIIGPETSVKYAIPKILHIEHLVLQTATWMTREHLLQLNCQYSELRDNTFTCEDLEVFAEHWRKNVRSKIERVWFGWDESKPFKLNEKLRVSRWDATKREREIIYTNQDGTRERLDCSDGYDFEREDGMLATFKFEDDVMCPGVHFLVWHERFPERKRLAELPKVLAPYYKQLEEINREYPNSSSLERMLANPSLKYDEFIDTFHILRSMDHEYHPVSLGRSARRRVFDRIYSLIDISD